MGTPIAEIAEVLGISPLTAKWHVSETLRKLGVSRRVQLALAAYELGHLEETPHSGAAPRRVAGDSVGLAELACAHANDWGEAELIKMTRTQLVVRQVRPALEHARPAVVMCPFGQPDARSCPAQPARGRRRRHRQPPGVTD